MKKLICVILSALLLSGCVAKPQQPTAATTAPVVAVPPGTTAAPTTPVPTTPVPTTQMKPYSAVRDGDRYLIDFPEGNFVRGPLYDSVFPERKTLGELKQTVLNGTYTDGEKLTMKKLLDTSEDGRLVICDLDALHEPTVPAEWRLTGVSLFYDKLRFYYDHDLLEEKSMTIRFLSEEVYQSGVENLTKPIEEEMVLKREYDSTRNAETIYLYKQEDRSGIMITRYSKMIRTHIQTGEKELFVEESYEWIENDLQGVISDMSPTHLEIVGKDCGVYFLVSAGMVYRPSFEYLSAFGVKPYVEPDAA